jgi:hypothetical protein
MDFRTAVMNIGGDEHDAMPFGHGSPHPSTRKRHTNPT